MGPLAWAAPERLWRPLSYPAGLLNACLHPGRTRRTARRIELALGGRRNRLTAYLTEIGHRAGRAEERLQVLRSHRPGGWQPRTRIIGSEHLARALDEGSGAILWVCSLLFSNLVTKIALHRAGFRLIHLSRFSHGFSQTALGMRWLNPIQIGIENRYLAERVVVPADGSLGFTRTLQRRLAANQLVSITARPGARRTETLPFLEGHVRLATGPADLALGTGAALLPVFTVRRGWRDFDITIESPLKAPAGAGRQLAIHSVLEQYVGLMASYATRHPRQWMWHLWDTM